MNEPIKLYCLRWSRSCPKCGARPMWRTSCGRRSGPKEFKCHHCGCVVEVIPPQAPSLFSLNNFSDKSQSGVMMARTKITPDMAATITTSRLSGMGCGQIGRKLNLSRGQVERFCEKNKIERGVVEFTLRIR